MLIRFSIPLNSDVRHQGSFMPAETIFVIVVAAIIVLGLVAKLLLKRQPKEKFFKCSRCNAVTRHTERTIKAWRDHKTTFFCQACHVKWLESQPPRVREQFSSRRGSGCLGVIAVVALLPPGCLLIWAYAHLSGVAATGATFTNDVEPRIERNLTNH